MGARTRVLQKGKITIPAEIRESLGISEGDFLTLEIVGNRIVLFPPRTVPNPTELLDGLAAGVAVEEPVKGGLRRASEGLTRRKLSRAE